MPSCAMYGHLNHFCMGGTDVEPKLTSHMPHHRLHVPPISFHLCVDDDHRHIMEMLPTFVAHFGTTVDGGPKFTARASQGHP